MRLRWRITQQTAFFAGRCGLCRGSRRFRKNQPTMIGGQGGCFGSTASIRWYASYRGGRMRSFMAVSTVTKFFAVFDELDTRRAKSLRCRPLRPGSRMSFRRRVPIRVLNRLGMRPNRGRFRLDKRCRRRRLSPKCSKTMPSSANPVNQSQK